MSIDNQGRAERAMEAAIEWAGYDYSAEILRSGSIADIKEIAGEVIGDMIGDLLHMAEACGSSVDVVLRAGRNHFEEEMEEERQEGAA